MAHLNNFFSFFFFYLFFVQSKAIVSCHGDACKIIASFLFSRHQRPVCWTEGTGGGGGGGGRDGWTFHHTAPALPIAGQTGRGVRCHDGWELSREDPPFQRSHFTYPIVYLTVGAPRMIEQPLFSILLCFRPFEGLHPTLILSTLLCCLPISFSVCLSFSLLVQCPVGSSSQVLLILFCAHTISVFVSSQW